MNLMKIAKIDYSCHENSPSWIGKSQEYGLMQQPAKVQCHTIDLENVSLPVATH